MWNDDVAVGRWTTPIKHRLDSVVRNGDHHAFRGSHFDLDTGGCCELSRPRAGRVHDVLCVNFRPLLAFDFRTHDSLIIEQEVCHRGVQEDFCIVFARAFGGGCDES